MKKGDVSIVLHSHMPFIRHPEVIDSIEERWLFEAMTECYLPLIQVYDSLIKDKINFKITMSITPTLMSMLQDNYLNKRFSEYIHNALELSEKEIKKNKENKDLYNLSCFYNERFKELINIYNNYDKNIINAFKKFVKIGVLEVITSSATHAFLPLLDLNREAIKAQISIGVKSYIKTMGQSPKGIWLPECAYSKNIDEILKEFGIKFFISEDKAIINANPRPLYGTYKPIATTNGICAFGRDMDSSKQVWSSVIGYPGDYSYREFYRDLGYDAPIEYIKPYINKGGIRIDTGIKYYKITGKTERKEYYNREEAMSKVKLHARHFAEERCKQIEKVNIDIKDKPIIVAPYDTELYGHWWFEGPDFIDEFIRVSSENWINYELTTPWKYLLQSKYVQNCEPAASSWGENSDYSVWLNKSNHWIYRDLHKAERNMIKLANTYQNPTEIERRILNQIARELLLAEASDWPFIIKNGTSVEYAVNRVNLHLERFNRLYDMITKDSIDESYLEKIEQIDNIFSDLDYRVYLSYNKTH
ncbi:1,4-alpha-glucan branching enzyme [Clostridium homopropionicum DSM 5847]|uniref:1,4-alpha-glucan branching enzyme n=1 Tax=Clostridium homopropionicum DSM 5847 TaxID=1121318 RepID=A0A0L6ZB41_9CLOT|nr:1,4-alpha-glucan branching protein domain-containing protein [Clostridium homopropionicum]KOA20181.1 1,4-alpha-glucan branching enzyme [Clostridium homopropionicum DSM 5847]SFG60089.1 1,4-alpha-glucan branching enzyme [Clostridium homopropionicum]